MPSLDKVRPLIETGDVLLLRRSRGWFGRAIRLWTESQYSHAGIIVWTSIECQLRLCVLEALETYGVRLYPLDRYVQDAHAQGFKLDWFRLIDPDVSRRRVALFAFDQLGKKYAVRQLLRSFLRLPSLVWRWLGWGKDVDGEERFYCSELVDAALRAGGWKPAPEDDVPADAAPPEAIAEMTCLHREGEITP